MRRWSRVLAALGILATYLVVTSQGVVPASAQVFGPDDQTLAGTPASMWQTNNTVLALAASGGRLYAGGDFTTVRPPGAAPGTSQTTRNRLAAFDGATGALITTFNPSLNGSVRGLAVSPDGTRLYVVGLFTQANGVTRNRIAAYSLPGGALITTFAPSASAGVISVYATNTTVYVGGDFGQINGVGRQKIAALSASNGSVITTFNAVVNDNRVNTIELAPDGSRLLIGGSFNSVNSAPNTGSVASLHPTTGATMPWAIGGTSPHTDNCLWNAMDIVTFGDTAYVSGEGSQPGCLDGTYAAKIADGTQVWISWCLGATQGLTIMNGWLYKSAHTHDCGYDEGGKMGGFVGPQNPNDFFWWRLTTQRLTDGSWAHWSPNTNGFTGTNPVGPRVMATDGTRLFVGGDFSTVNNAAQQGITRFVPGNSAPLRPVAPSVTATAAGTLTVIVPTVEDRDSGTLTYRIFRDGGTTPVATRTAVSWPWTRPRVRFDDTGLAPGSSHTYTVTVSDTALTSQASPASAPVTVRATEPPAFPAEVLAADPSSYWRLDGTGTSLADSSPNGATGVTVGGVTAGQDGAIDDNDAVALDGSTGYLASGAAAAAPAAFTQSAWFKTSTLRGGAIMGFSNEQTGAGTLNDRAVWMENNGQVVFGLRSSATGNRFTYVRSPGAYNDGAWHQVVATYNGTTISLYVDGALAAALPAAHAGSGTGYLRAGYLNLTTFDTVFGRNLSGKTAPLSFFLNGSLDEVAAYPAALSATQVRNQFIASVPGGPGEPPPPPPPPVDGYADVVVDDGPSLYWRLGDSSGSPISDASGNGRTGTYRAGLTYGIAGAIVGDPDTAVGNPGTSGIGYTNTSTAGPTTYSLETWLRTTSTRGGKLIGLENVQTGWGTTYDRQLYLTNAGVVTYGIRSGGVQRTISSPAALNNNAWHHIVATQDASGMKLYVDGTLVSSAAFATPDAATGFWRVGGGNLTGWPGAPTSAAMAGTQDEVAVYPAALTAGQIAEHYAEGSGA